jgi:hypothetical protein
MPSMLHYHLDEHRAQGSQKSFQRAQMLRQKLLGSSGTEHDDWGVCVSLLTPAHPVDRRCT